MQKVNWGIFFDQNLLIFVFKAIKLFFINGNQILINQLIIFDFNLFGVELILSFGNNLWEIAFNACVALDSGIKLSFGTLYLFIWFSKLLLESRLLLSFSSQFEISSLFFSDEGLNFLLLRFDLSHESVNLLLVLLVGLFDFSFGISGLVV